MKKNTRNGKKLLALGQETVRTLGASDLKDVAGAGSCLPPPPPRI